MRHLHPHWLTVFWPVVWLLLIVGGASFGMRRDPGRTAAGDPPAARARASPSSCCCSSSCVPLLRWRSTHYVITTHRLLFRAGHPRPPRPRHRAGPDHRRLLPADALGTDDQLRHGDHRVGRRGGRHGARAHPRQRRRAAAAQPHDRGGRRPPGPGERGLRRASTTHRDAGDAYAAHRADWATARVDALVTPRNRASVTARLDRFCRYRHLPSAHAAAAHLRLAHRPVAARHRSARRAGGGARRAGRGRRRRAGRRRRWSPATSTTGRSPRPTPPRVLDRVLRGCAAAGAAVVLTPGNHDSARRLGFGAGLLAVAGRAPPRRRPPKLDEPVLLADAHGEVAVYGLPYLEPEVARHELGLPEARSHEAVLDRGHGPGARRPRLRPGTRSVVLAHAFVGGGLASDSERDICVGGVDLVPAAGLRRRRLRRARPPAPAADAQRRGCATAARRWPTPSARPGSRSWPGWSTSTRAGWPRCAPVPLPVPRPLTVLTGALDELLADPALDAGRRGPLRLRPAHRPGPPGRPDAPAAGPVPALRAPGVGRQRRAGRRPQLPASGCAAAATSRSPASSSRTSAGVAGHRRRSASCSAGALGAADREEAGR